jgi:hypothetical protein
MPQYVKVLTAIVLRTYQAPTSYEAATYWWATESQPIHLSQEITWPNRLSTQGDEPNEDASSGSPFTRSNQYYTTTLSDGKAKATPDLQLTALSNTAILFEQPPRDPDKEATPSKKDKE